MCKRLLILVVVMLLSMACPLGVAYGAELAYEEFLERETEVYELDIFSDKMKETLAQVTEQ